jgi:hypothetical protein
MKKHVLISAILSLFAVVEVSALGSHKHMKLRYKSGEKAKEYLTSLGQDPMEL